MSKFFTPGLESIIEDYADDVELDDEGVAVPDPSSELEGVTDDLQALATSRTIENTLTAKYNRGEELTDEEVYIATETIGKLYSFTAEGFNGFGFEAYEGKELTKRERDRIALEAISGQNVERGKSIGKRLENFSNGLSDYASWFSGNMEKLRKDAQQLLTVAEAADEKDFNAPRVTDPRVSVAVQRGRTAPPFKDYKQVLKALEGLIDSLKVVSSVSKYESLGSGEGTQFDLAKLAKDVHGRIIKRTATQVTYDLNPEKLTGTTLILTAPSHSENHYLIRNLKANFVISVDKSQWNITEGNHGVVSTTLSRKEAIDLLRSVLKYIDEQEYLFKLYYRDAKVTIGDMFKFLGKLMLNGPLVLYNSVIFRARIQDLNSSLHYINRRCLRGLIAWVAASMD